MFIPSGIAIFSMRTFRRSPRRTSPGQLKSIFEGHRVYLGARIILSLFLLDFGVTLVGFYNPILPIFAADVFKTGASGLASFTVRRRSAPSLARSVLLMIGNVKRMGVLVIGAAVVVRRQPGSARCVQLVLDGGRYDAYSRFRRLGERRDPPHGGTNARADGMLGRASSLITAFAQATNGLGAVLAGFAAQQVGAPMRCCSAARSAW
jgi:hypothetical protein